MKKGIELPINILVIVAVAIIVLLGVIALFYSSWFSGTAPIGSESQKAGACTQANRNSTCQTDCMCADTYTVGTQTLLDFCNVTYGIDVSADCLRSACGMAC